MKLCKANPIPGDAGWYGAWGTRARGVVAPNKPNLPPRGTEDHGEEPALSAANGPEALMLPPVRGQARETKPISVHQSDTLDLEPVTVCRAHRSLCV
jgi:hypothetical protein